MEHEFMANHTNRNARNANVFFEGASCCFPSIRPTADSRRVDEITDMAALFTRQCGNAVCSWTPKLSIRNLTFSARRCLDEPEQYWRSRNGLPKNPNAYGPLTDNRDFSFADGRPVPLGVGQSKRVLNHRKHAEKILQCVKEMDFAVERHQRMELEAEEMKQAILNKKLKPKGHLLLKKSTSET